MYIQAYNFDDNQRKQLMTIQFVQILNAELDFNIWNCLVYNNRKKNWNIHEAITNANETQLYKDNKNSRCGILANETVIHQKKLTNEQL